MVVKIYISAKVESRECGSLRNHVSFLLLSPECSRFTHKVRRLVLADSRLHLQGRASNSAEERKAQRLVVGLSLHASTGRVLSVLPVPSHLEQAISSPPYGWGLCMPLGAKAWMNLYQALLRMYHSILKSSSVCVLSVAALKRYGNWVLWG